MAFAGRVLGQAVQRWTPKPYLPPFDDFQGSALPYWLLLSLQILILALMVRVSLSAQAGKLVHNPRMGKVLAWFGAVYMAGSIGRIAVGLLAAGATPWFRTWIPAVFHVVLAGFVLTLAWCHLRQARPAVREPQQ